MVTSMLQRRLLLMLMFLVMPGCFDDIERPECSGAACGATDASDAAGFDGGNNGNNGVNNGNNGVNNGNNGADCDGACEDGEAFHPDCPEDCPCGDFHCDADTETEESCHLDCPTCEQNAEARCELGESPRTCADCEVHGFPPPGPSLTFFNAHPGTVRFKFGGHDYELASGEPGWTISIDAGRVVPLIVEFVEEQSRFERTVVLAHDNIFVAHLRGPASELTHVTDRVPWDEGDEPRLLLFNGSEGAKPWAVADSGAGNFPSGGHTGWVPVPAQGAFDISVGTAHRRPEPLPGLTSWFAVYYWDNAMAQERVAVFPYRKIR